MSCLPAIFIVSDVSHENGQGSIPTSPRHLLTTTNIFTGLCFGEMRPQGPNVGPDLLPCGPRDAGLPFRDFPRRRKLEVSSYLRHITATLSGRADRM